MGWRRVAGCLATVVIIVTTSKVLLAEQVSEPQPVRAPRPFGILRSWTNLGDPRRTPIEERLAPAVVGRGGVIPPQIRRQGFIPRFSLVQEYTDNLFFTADDRSADLITAFSPGLHYIMEVPRGRLEADYTFEGTFYANNPDLNSALESQTASLSGQFQVTKRTGLGLSERYESSTPPALRLSEVRPFEAATRTITQSTVRQNYLTLTGVHSFTPLVDLRLRYNHILLDFEDPEEVGSLTSEGTLGLRSQVTRRDRLDLEYRFRFFDFEEGIDIHTHTALLSYEHDVSDTLSLTGRLGVVRAGDELQLTDFVAQGSVRTSVKMAIFEIGYARRIEGGVGSIFVSQTASGSALIRLARGLRVNARTEYSLNSAEAGGDEKNQTLDISAVLTYALRPWLIARLTYGFAREEDKRTAIVITANRITWGLTASF